MKWLVSVLLLANLVLLAWQHESRRDLALRTLETRATPLPPAPALQLLSERAELPRPRGATPPRETASAAEVVAGVAAAAHCVEVGPFTSTVERDRVRDGLREQVARMAVRHETVREQRFFWVYLEPGSDAAAARDLADLRARGVTDYLLIRRGEMRNAISLGVFRSQDSVNRRLAEMSEKGYQPVVVPRFETREQDWLVAQPSAAQSVTDAWPAGLPATLQVRTADCGLLASLTENLVDDTAAATEANDPATDPVTESNADSGMGVP